MPDSSSTKRSFGSGIPVVHQGELDEPTRRTFHDALPYEPITDRFALPSVTLHVEERWPDDILGVRVMLRTAGWRSLPNLPPDLAADEDIEDAFLGMATRLPANFVEFLTGATLQYDTNSFLREEHRAYRMEYRIMGTAEQVVHAVQELRRTNDIRWKKAHLMMLGYLPGGEESSEERARELADRMYGPGTADAWSEEVAAYDKELAAFYQQHALSKLPPPPPPVPQDISFNF